MEERKVFKTWVRSGHRSTITSVLPQASETGFFLVRKDGDADCIEPIVARKITIETMDGKLLEVTVNREAPNDARQGKEEIKERLGEAGQA